MNEKEQYETELSEMRLDEETPFYNEQRAESIYKVLRKEGVKRVLDVGCGLGKVTMHLAQRGLDATGIDVSPRLIELAQEKVSKSDFKVHFEVVELDKFEVEEKFDVVLFAGVLEHIEDEVQMMCDAKRLLKPHGKIVITDNPTFNWLFTARDRRIGHIRRYTKKMLRQNLNASGYKDIKLIYYNFLMLFGSIYLKVTKKDEYPYGNLNPTVNKLMYWWYKYLENNFVFPIGDRLIAIATPLEKEESSTEGHKIQPEHSEEVKEKYNENKEESKAYLGDAENTEDGSNKEENSS